MSLVVDHSSPLGLCSLYGLSFAVNEDGELATLEEES